MRCQQLIDDFLRDYVDNKLSFGERVRFRLHLAHCRNCRRYLDGYRQTVTMTKQAGADGHAATPDVPDELVKAILASRPPRE